MIGSLNCTELCCPYKGIRNYKQYFTLPMSMIDHLQNNLFFEAVDHDFGKVTRLLLHSIPIIIDSLSVFFKLRDHIIEPCEWLSDAAASI